MRMPGFIEPQLATLRVHAPEGADWIHEIKYDGYRLQAHLNAGKITVYTRGGLDWTNRFRSLVAALQKLKVKSAIFDGELIVEKDGRSNFSELQAELSAGRQERLNLYVFDLLYFNDRDLRALPQIKRKEMLAKVLAKAKPPLFYSEHFVTSGAAIFEQACKLNLEGIIAKKADAPYRSERSEAWLKIKCSQIGRFEVIGFKEGRNAATALYLGKREGDELLYAGKAGTGFTDQMTEDLRTMLDPITLPKSPLSRRAKKPMDRFVKPKYWAEVEYRDITSDGLLRHVSFRGLYPSQKSKSPVLPRRRA